MKFSELKHGENLRTDRMLITDSLYVALRDLPPESRGRASFAVLEYGFTGDAEISGDESVLQLVTAFARPIDKGIEYHLRKKKQGEKGAEYGATGGRPTREMMQVLDAWNELATEYNLPTQDHCSRGITTELRRLFAAGETPESIIKTLHNIEKSRYLQGDNKSNVKAHIGWMLKHYDEVESGNYNDSNGDISWDNPAPF